MQDQEDGADASRAAEEERPCTVPAHFQVWKVSSCVQQLDQSCTCLHRAGHDERLDKHLWDVPHLQHPSCTGSRASKTGGKGSEPLLDLNCLLLRTMWG